jgi:hypothetical protein
MKRYASLLAVLVIANTAFSQEPATIVSSVSAPSETIASSPSVFDGFVPSGESNGFLTGNHNFPRFIGFVGNPLFNIDPRAVTEIVPLFDTVSVSTSRFLPDGNAQIYGPAVTVALSDRLSIGMNQGGYVVSDFAKNREGLLNLGGFLQYTVIEDVPNQFLATAGMRWVAPIAGTFLRRRRFVVVREGLVGVEIRHRASFNDFVAFLARFASADHDDALADLGDGREALAEMRRPVNHRAVRETHAVRLAPRSFRVRTNFALHLRHVVVSSLCLALVESDQKEAGYSECRQCRFGPSRYTHR